MMNWIGSHVGGTDVVTIQPNKTGKNNTKVVKQLLNPNSLSSSVAGSMALSLSGGFRDRGLLLGALGDKVGSKVYCLVSGEETGVFAASQVSILISHNDGRGCRKEQQKAMILSTVQISESA